MSDRNANPPKAEPRGCACRSADPYDCARLRYPYAISADDDFGELACEQVEPCECVCHDEWVSEDEY